MKIIYKNIIQIEQNKFMELSNEVIFISNDYLFIY